MPGSLVPGFRSHFWTLELSPYPTVRGPQSMRLGSGSDGSCSGTCTPWWAAAHQGGRAEGTFHPETQEHTSGILKQWSSAPRVGQPAVSLQQNF